MELFNSIVKPLADFLKGYGVDVVLVIVIVILTSIVKMLDKRNKIKKWYVLVPFIFALGLCFLSPRFNWKAWLQDSIIYGALSSAGYNLYTKLIRDRKKT